MLLGDVDVGGVASEESRIKKYIYKKNSEESRVGNRWLELVGLTPFLTT